MEEIVFAPDSGAGFIAGLGAFIGVLGLLGAALFARRQLATQDVDLGAWAAAALFVCFGGGLAYWAASEAQAVSVRGTQVVLRYPWAHPDRTLDARDIQRVRVDFRGTKRPSPRLVIEMRSGDTFEGEGTSDFARVDAARAAIDAAAAASHRADKP